MPIPDPPPRSSASLRIIVPKPAGTRHTFIRPGSAIVGYEPENIPGGTLIYYEGNIYGIENLQTYWQRLLCAAGRCAQRYPTVARCLFANEAFDIQFEVVGVFNYAITHKQLADKNLRQFRDADEIVHTNCDLYHDKLSALEHWIGHGAELSLA